MTDLRARLKNFRRSSSAFPVNPKLPPTPSPSRDLSKISRTSSSKSNNKKRSSILGPSYPESPLQSRLLPGTLKEAQVSIRESPPPTLDVNLDFPTLTPPPPEEKNPKVAIEPPTPERRGRSENPVDTAVRPAQNPGRLGEVDAKYTGASRQTIAARRQSPVPESHSKLFSGLKKPEDLQRRAVRFDYAAPDSPFNMPKMHRKLWVKRPNATATQVAIDEEDLVDDVKDMILRKYTNSLGRNFDSPDVSLRITLRPPTDRRSVSELSLAPEDNMAYILDHHYPGGQNINEALIVDVPRRTPRHSPHTAVPYYVADHVRPVENGTDYFPPMPITGSQSPHLPINASVSSGPTRPPHNHSISVIETGHVPILPSPGSRIVRHSARPRVGRQHTSSPNVLSASTHSGSHENHLNALTTQAHSTPPLPPEIKPHRSSTPPPRVSSPRPKANKKPKKSVDVVPALAGVLDGAVPPINVLIVEDNMINLKLLEAFLKRLKVRWKTAMNGRDAVTTWREGGFHLVVMDIQMPVMNGLDATKEIRRLERVNNIGVLSNSVASTPAFRDACDTSEAGKGPGEELNSEDMLMNTALFKSSVIIVALTASSLQSDRHEALAAGCNDFLTKPVSFDWLSRKVMEWGCMQALIDFDGWRKWKDFSTQTKNAESKSKPEASTAGIKPPKVTLANGRVKRISLPLTADGGMASDGTDTNGEDGSGNEVAVNA